LAPTGALSDALSTAWMIMTPEAIVRYCQQHPATGALLLPNDSSDKSLSVERFGMFIERG
ncbi:MAG: FAD:protein FMN transferase, partial [Calditrichaeota bacterium]|nr:FAD:protein FMN transferase [Calditrichota bacterium]